MHYHTSVLAVIIAVASFILSSCTNSAQEQNKGAAGSSGARLKVAIMSKSSTHVFWKAIHAGAEKAAQESNIEIIWRDPQQGYSQQEQNQTIQTLTNQGVDGFVLTPFENKTLTPLVDNLVKKDIAVVIIDSELSSTNFSSLVSSDNKFGGKLCGKRLVELLGGKGKVIMLRCHKNSMSTVAREEGFIEVVQEYGPSIELIATDQYGGITVEQAFQKSQELLNRFGQVDGVFTSNESTTEGMLQALRKSGKAAKVKFIGFDSNPTIVTGLENNEIHGLAVQNPFKMGYESVKTIAAVLKKQPYDKRIDTGVMLITAENLGDSQIQELLNPDLTKWLNK